jgi:hypothetical protein
MNEMRSSNIFLMSAIHTNTTKKNCAACQDTLGIAAQFLDGTLLNVAAKVTAEEIKRLRFGICHFFIAAQNTLIEKFPAS